MTFLLAALVCLTPQVQQPLPTKEGRIVHYSPNVMERVIHRRGLDKLYHRSGVKGAVATPNCANVGKLAWLQIGRERPEKVLIADCAEPKDYASQVARGLVGETDYQTARRHGFLDEGHTTGRIWLIRER